ncbi:uncharacterized protein FYW47_002501 [Aplochiton taeniatus]
MGGGRRMCRKGKIPVNRRVVEIDRLLADADLLMLPPLCCPALFDEGFVFCCAMYMDKTSVLRGGPSSSSPRLLTKSLSLEPTPCQGHLDTDMPQRLSSDPGSSPGLGAFEALDPLDPSHGLVQSCSYGTNNTEPPEFLAMVPPKTRPPLPGPKPQVPPKPPHLQQHWTQPHPRAPEKPLPPPPSCRPLRVDTQGRRSSPTMPPCTQETSSSACVLSLIEKFEREQIIMVPDITAGALW